MLEKVTTMENLIVVEIVDGKKMDSIVAVSQGGRKLQVSIRIIIVTTLLHPPFIGIPNFSVAKATIQSHYFEFSHLIGEGGWFSS